MGTKTPKRRGSGACHDHHYHAVGALVVEHVSHSQAVRNVFCNEKHDARRYNDNKATLPAIGFAEVKRTFMMLIYEKLYSVEAPCKF